MARGRVLATAACLPLSSAVVLSTRSEAASSSDDACKCLNWQETLAHGDQSGQHALCGEYAETYSQTNGRLDMSVQDIEHLWLTKMAMMKEFCSDYIMRLNETFCYTINDHAIEQGSWCYVASACKDLNGGKAIADKHTDQGKPLTRNLSAKICRKGEDAFMNEMNPHEMAAFAEKNKIMMGMTFLANYEKLMPSTLEDPVLWQHIEPLWRAGDVARMPEKLRKAISANRPIILYTGGDFHSHYKLAWGSSLFSLDRDDANCPASHCFTEDRALGK